MQTQVSFVIPLFLFCRLEIDQFSQYFLFTVQWKNLDLKTVKGIKLNQTIFFQEKFVFAQVEAGYLLTLLQPNLEVSLQQNLISILSGTRLQIWRSFY
jgi:hypothetical protein